MTSASFSVTFFFFSVLKPSSQVQPRRAKPELREWAESDVSWKYFKSHKRQHQYQADEKPWYHVSWLMPHSSYTTHTGTCSGMLSQEHHSLLLQSWQSSEKSSLLMSPQDFFIWLIIRGLLAISTVFGTPTDLSHIFCQTSVNIYCGDLVLLSAVIVNLPSLCLLTDESDPWPGGAEGRGWRMAFICCVCRDCVCERWSFLLKPQGHWDSPLSHYARVCHIISLYPVHTLKKPQLTRSHARAHTHTTTTTLWPVTKGGTRRGHGQLKRRIWGSVMDEMRGC